MDFGTTNDNKKYLKILYDLFGLDGRVEDAAKSADFPVIFADWTRTYNVTTGSAGGVTGTLFPLLGSHRRIRFVKVDAGTSKFILAADGAEKIGVEGAASTFELYSQGDWVEVEDMGTYWDIVGISEGKWIKVTDPAVGFFDTKTAGWTADRFTAATGGWEVSFAALVPEGTKRIRLVIAMGSSADGHLAFARKCGDAAISNTPNASQEWSHIIAAAVNNISHYNQTTLWLSSDYKVEFAVNHVDVNIYLAYVSEYFRQCGSP